MSTGRVLALCAALVVAWVGAILGAMLWPIGNVPPITIVDIWLTGFVSVGVGVLLYSTYRQVAVPLADALRSLRLAAAGLPAPSAAEHFGRSDEIGGLALALCAVQGRRAQLQEDLLASQTGLEQTKGELAAVSRRVEEVLEAIPTPISMEDLIGRIVFVNRAWERCFGLARDRVIGVKAGADGQERQREVRLQGQLYVCSHAVIPDLDGEPSVVLTTFRAAGG